MSDQKQGLGTFRGRLRYLMEQDGVTVEELAEKTNRTVPAIKTYLQKDTTPKADVIVALHQHYPKWSIGYLLTGEGNPQRTEKETEPANLQGFTQNTVRWLSYWQEVAQDAETLPPNGYQILYHQVSEQIQELLQENRDLLLRLEQIEQDY